MKLRVIAKYKAGRKPKWSPDIKHKKETKVVLPDIQIKGIYQDLVADIILDPMSGGYEAIVEIMGTIVKAWALKINDARKYLIEKVKELIAEMGWDKTPKYARQSFVMKFVVH